MVMCRLRVVLFVSGRGSDAKSYKPERDETQWWSRRDALVRTVASLLFGPTAKKQQQQRELVLLFDEDFAEIHMSYDPGSRDNNLGGFYPTERNVVTVWKDAASRAGNKPSCLGLQCEIRTTTSLASADRTISDSQSKREILELLQASCTIEFLRQHHLNCSPAIALRKANRKNLIKVWHQWKTEQSTAKGLTKNKENYQKAALEGILSNLLASSDSSTQKVVAATLHESSSAELPCFNQKCEQEASEARLCLFLGAVRDMSRLEKKALSNVCTRLGVPLLNVRLGPVPEFTSKILSVVAFHHSSGMLWPSTKALLADEKQRKRRSQSGDTLQATKSPCPTLHFVIFVPFASSSFKVDLESRNRPTWCLVRCVVAALWRSKVAGGESVSVLDVSVTLRFMDGICVRLDQDGLVKSMAEQHQAAPSEFQILGAVKLKLDEAIKQNSKRVVLLDEVETTDPCFALDLSHDTEGAPSLSDFFYSQGECCESHTPFTVTVVMAINGLQTEEAQKCLVEAKEDLLKDMTERKIAVFRGSLVDASCQDAEAAQITLLQHFAYQNRLVGFFDNACVAKQTSELAKTKKKKKRV